MAIPEHIHTLKLSQKKSLLKKKNVIGLGYGYRFTAGKRTDNDTLIVLVSQKEPKASLSTKELVPAKLDGVEIDVRSIGRVIAHQSRTDRWRPAPPGVSVGHYLITAGTLGAIVKDASTGEQLILSNNHVMANSNDAFKGDDILQPGAVDGGRRPDDVIAKLERFIRIDMGSGDDDGGGGDDGTCPFANLAAGFMNLFAKGVGSQHRLVAKKLAATANLVDAALAKPVNTSIISDEIVDIGKITGVVQAELGMSVRKSGRTTAFTTGTIDVLGAAIDVSYGASKVAHFEEQIITSAMSQPGDSGSLLVHGSENKAVGLLFAGSDTVTIHCPIETVMSLLNFTF
ncbi:hypothetical protein JW960_28290 [candidate division KSB1 bacterium]|nr:hypothetical protein [candidate division KSB1 bacterium]